MDPRATTAPCGSAAASRTATADSNKTKTVTMSWRTVRASRARIRYGRTTRIITAISAWIAAMVANIAEQLAGDPVSIIDASVRSQLLK